MFSFYGRANKSEFWKVNLIVLGVGVILQLIALGLFGNVSLQMQTYIDGILSGFSLLTTLPLLALGARRLHDIGKSGWWQLLALTVVGIIPLTVWFLRNGDKNENAYGPPN